MGRPFLLLENKENPINPASNKNDFYSPLFEQVIVSVVYCLFSGQICRHSYSHYTLVLC